MKDIEKEESSVLVLIFWESVPHMDMAGGMDMGGQLLQLHPIMGILPMEILDTVMVGKAVTEVAATDTVAMEEDMVTEVT